MNDCCISVKCFFLSGTAPVFECYKKIALCYASHTKHINALCGQKERFYVIVMVCKVTTGLEGFIVTYRL